MGDRWIECKGGKREGEKEQGNSRGAEEMAVKAWQSSEREER